MAGEGHRQGHGKELIAYLLNDSGPPLVCGPTARAWMDATDGRFAYRCLPMLIANQSGWFVLNERPFEAKWNGTRDQSGVEIRYLTEGSEGSVTSHFGEGIITWHIPYLFRTPEGVQPASAGTRKLAQGRRLRARGTRRV